MGITVMSPCFTTDGSVPTRIYMPLTIEAVLVTGCQQIGQPLAALRVPVGGDGVSVPQARSPKAIAWRE
jgi:hypothetical protein